MALKDIPRLHRNNMQTLRASPVSELSGALGDLGTLLPLMIALAKQGSVSLPATLVFSGIANVATGVLFGIPLPVQPMKAIAAAAIASRLTLRETVAAGALVAAAVLLLAVTGLLRWQARHIPVPVVKGIQLGAALSLVIAAGGSLRPLHWALPPFDNRLWALAAFLVLIATQRMARVPYALIMFLLGLLLAFVALAVGSDGHSPGRRPGFMIWKPTLVVPNWASGEAWGDAVAQLPLTMLNSVVAVSALAADLLPSLPAPSVTALGLSVGLMNLAGCWFGAMPVCHGAGGLAAQYRFGARSGASIILLGIFKLVLGLVFGETLLDLLMRFPQGILGIMVIAAGLELAMVGQSLNHGAPDLWEVTVGEPGGGGSIKRQKQLSEDERRERWTVMLMTAAGILGFRNDAVGFMAGMLCHYAYRLSAWIAARHQRRHHVAESDPLIQCLFRGIILQFPKQCSTSRVSRISMQLFQVLLPSKARPRLCETPSNSKYSFPLPTRGISLYQ